MLGEIFDRDEQTDSYSLPFSYPVTWAGTAPKLEAVDHPPVTRASALIG